MARATIARWWLLIGVVLWFSPIRSALADQTENFSSGTQDGPWPPQWTSTSYLAMSTVVTAPPAALSGSGLVGRIGGPSGGQSNQHLAEATPALDSDQAVDIAGSTSTVKAVVLARRSAPDTYYGCLVGTSDRLRFFKGTPTNAYDPFPPIALPTPPAGVSLLSTTAWRRLRFKVTETPTGTLLQAKLWQGPQQPDGWTLEWTDTSSHVVRNTPGQSGIGVSGMSATKYVYFDNYRLTDENSPNCAGEADCSGGDACWPMSGRHFNKHAAQGICAPPICQTPTGGVCGSVADDCGQCSGYPRPCTADSDCVLGEMCGASNGPLFDQPLSARFCWEVACEDATAPPAWCGGPELPCGDCDCGIECERKACGESPANSCGSVCSELCNRPTLADLLEDFPPLHYREVTYARDPTDYFNLPTSTPLPTVPLSPLLRRENRFIFVVPTTRPVTLTTTFTNDSVAVNRQVDFNAYNAAGTVILRKTLTPDPSTGQLPTSVSLGTLTAGNYEFTIEPRNDVATYRVSADLGVFVALKNGADLAEPNSSVYFYVPAEVETAFLLGEFEPGSSVQFFGPNQEPVTPTAITNKIYAIDARGKPGVWRTSYQTKSSPAHFLNLPDVFSFHPDVVVTSKRIRTAMESSTGGAATSITSPNLRYNNRFAFHLAEPGSPIFIIGTGTSIGSPPPIVVRMLTSTGADVPGSPFNLTPGVGYQVTPTQQLPAGDYELHVTNPVLTSAYSVTVPPHIPFVSVDGYGLGNVWLATYKAYFTVPPGTTSVRFAAKPAVNSNITIYNAAGGIAPSQLTSLGSNVYEIANTTPGVWAINLKGDYWSDIRLLNVPQIIAFDPALLENVSSSGPKLCTTNADCSGGEVCGHDNGTQFGLDPTSDVCWPATCEQTPAASDCGSVLASCGTCTGPTCAATEDCSVTQFCAQSGRCREEDAPCSVDSQCLAGKACHQASCACVNCEAGEPCVEDTECATGLICGADQGPRFGRPRGQDVCISPDCLLDPQLLGCGTPGATCGENCLNAVPCDPEGNDCGAGETCLVDLDVGLPVVASPVCAPEICETAPTTRCGTPDSECGTCQCAPQCTGKGCGDDNGCGEPCVDVCDDGDPCTRDADCHPGSVCGHGIGERFGQAPGTNACWSAACAAGTVSAECPGNTKEACVGEFCGDCPSGSFRTNGECLPSILSLQPNGSNFPDPLGPLPTDDVGATNASFRVTPNGLAQYTIPIEVPPGRLGIQPGLAFGYTSTKKDGPLGIGWSLTGLSSISRCRSVLGRDGKAKPVTLDETDRFCLDGQALIQIPSDPPVSYGATGTEYRTEIDTFTKVVAFGTTSERAGPSYFRAWTKDGRILTFGKSDDSSVFVDSTNQRIKRIWAISSFEDRAGNIAFVRYQKHMSIGSGRYPTHDTNIIQDTGEILPELVSYGGKRVAENELWSPSKSASRFVRFFYEDRPDPIHHYLAGAEGFSTHRLKQVKTYVEDTLVKTYILDYEQVTSGSSQVSSIQECAPDEATGDTVCKGKTSFEYFAHRELNRELDTKPTDAHPASGVPPIVLDSDGDGMDEILSLRGDTTLNYPQCRNGQVHCDISMTFTLTSAIPQPSGELNLETSANVELLLPGPSTDGWRHHCISQESVADLDGDGRDNLYYMCSGGARDGALHDALVAYGREGNTWREKARYPVDHFEGLADFADLDGDGRKDLVWCEGTGNVWYSLNVIPLGEVGPLFRQSQLAATIDNCHSLRIIDVDSDGADEIVDTHAGEVYSIDQQAFVLLPGASAEVLGWQEGNLGMANQLADFNGDGLKDAVRGYFLDSSMLTIGMNTGRGIEKQNFRPDIGQPAINSQRILAVTDVDGNGTEDLLTDHEWISYAGPGKLNIHPTDILAYPNRYSAFAVWQPSFSDLDGDGNPELLVRSSNSYLPSFESGRAKLLHSATDGLGKRIEIDYDGWSSYADRDNPTPVGRRTYAPPSSCFDETASFTCAKRMSGLVSATREVLVNIDPFPVRKAGPERHYSYQDFRMDRNGRGSLGVGRRTVALATLSKTEEIYSNKDYRLAGNLEQTSTIVGNAAESSSFGHASALCSLSQISWTTRTGAAPGISFAFQSVRNDYEGHPFQGVCNWVKHQRTATDSEDVDQYGSILKQTEKTETRGPNGVSTVTRITQTPRENRSDWLIGLLDRSILEETRGGEHLIRLINYEYDDRGLLILAEREPERFNTSLYRRTVIDRNVFGLPFRACLQDNTLVENERCTEVLSFDQYAIFADEVSNAEGLVTKLERSPHDGHLLVATDPNNLVSEFAYDAFGRLRAERTPTSDGYFRYSPAPVEASSFGDLTIFGAFNVYANFVGLDSSSTTYDAAGRVVAQSRSGFHSAPIHTERAYDEFGRLVLESLPHEAEDTSQGLNRYAYSGLGRLASVTAPTGLVTNYYHVDHLSALNAGSNADSWFDSTDGAFALVEQSPRGNIRVNVRDVFGDTARVLEAADVNGSDQIATDYHRGAFGRLNAVDTPNGTVGYAPDLYGRVEVTAEPGLASRMFEHNGFDEVTWAHSFGTDTFFEYDNLGRQTEILDASGNVLASFSFDGDGPNELGQLVATSRQTLPGSVQVNSTRLHYNSRGLLSSLEHRVGAEATDPDGTGTRYTVNYDYGVSTGWETVPWTMKRVRYPNVGGGDFAVDFSYDAAGTLVKVHKPDAPEESYWELTDSDQGFRIAEERFGNGAISRRSYYSMDTQDVQCSGGGASCAPGTLRQVTTEISGSTVQDIRYLYDRNGNVGAVSPFGSAPIFYQYGYDGQDRLTRQTTYSVAGTSETEYIYNSGGDLQYKTGIGTYAYSDHRLDVGSSTYTFDPRGNQHERSGPLVEGGYQRLDYDELDMPYRVITGTSPGAKITYFEYEASGTRVLKRESVAGGERMTVSIDELYERTTAPGTTAVNRYRVYAGSRVVAEILRTDSGDSTTAYLHADRLGSPTVVTGGQGDVVDSRAFEPFGNTSGALGSDARAGFTGHAHDEELGLINMRGRLYDAKLGRFLTPDPFVAAPLRTQGWNRYAYVLNNPLGYTDPSGFQPMYGGDGPPPPIVVVAPTVYTLPAPPSVPSGGTGSTGGTGGTGGSPSPSTPNNPGTAQPPTGSMGGAPAATSTYDGSGGIAPSGPGASPSPMSYGGTAVYGTPSGYGGYNGYSGYNGPALPSSLPAAGEGGPWEAALGAVMVLLADDVTGIGAADDIAIPIVLAGALAYDVAQRTFITYTLTNPISGQVYVGRTSGFGDPYAVLRARMGSHHMVPRGFDVGKVDSAVQGLHGYPAIRGREQQLLDSLGGVGSPGVANAIRGVSKANPAGHLYHSASDLYFGPLHAYTGY